MPQLFWGSGLRRSLWGQTTLPEVGEGGWKTSLVAPGEDHVSALLGESNSGPCFLLLSVPTQTD